ncbi:alpha/beta fold hydrolase [Gordonia polyisoprenivorans]|uniref:alpha/beta fold hydrolase n=1 Tax=Gordonia polyisoprenivorans TaxID=84595 RepID=UPI001AD684A2|nr:alpha/beta hydrolase [Gordonia polyisoprenivorans]QTI66946.1 alpha/beta hydrolase [Gordonia polyisoprenivorans]
MPANDNRIHARGVTGAGSDSERAECAGAGSDSERAGCGAADVLIVMPGTGSDANFVRRAFGPAAREIGVDLIALDPTDDLIGGHRDALRRFAADHARVLVGGFSIGAALALEWALGPGRERCVGVWAAMPAWSGEPSTAFAATGAAMTASALRADGLEATIDAMSSTSPPWLAHELTRSWRALYPGLVVQLERAAAYRAPDLGRIAGLSAPLAVVAADDDPLHPWAVAQSWYDAAPRSRIERIHLAQWGADPAVLGRACAIGWRSLVDECVETDESAETTDR